MISVRNAKYSNIKFVLIYLVIFGHLIEPGILSNRWLEIIYGIIYSFHMPLFAFLSGLFVKSEENCEKQGISLLKLYCLLQGIIVIAAWGKQDAFTPFWHLWYLLSSCMWMLLGRLWLRYGKAYMGQAVLLCAVALGCIVGYIPWINRIFSLSRSIVFFPFYFAGLLCREDTVGKKYKKLSWVTATVAFLLFFIIKTKIPVTFYYQAEPYSSLYMGWLYRLITYGIGGGFSFFILNVVPSKKYFFTKFGADTFIPYLLHGPIVLLLRMLPLPWYVHPFLAFLLILLLYRLSCMVYRIYGIKV